MIALSIHKLNYSLHGAESFLSS